MTNRRMLRKQMASYTVVQQKLLPSGNKASEAMVLWCEENIGPMDEDWAVTLRETERPRGSEMVWLFRCPDAALAFTLRFRGR